MQAALVPDCRPFDSMYFCMRKSRDSGTDEPVDERSKTGLTIFGKLHVDGS